MQEEMLGSVRDSGEAEWSVLMMDTITTKVMSSSCRISDVLDYGVSCESLTLPTPWPPVLTPCTQAHRASGILAEELLAHLSHWGQRFKWLP
jgi:hypothetical protein